MTTLRRVWPALAASALVALAGSPGARAQEDAAATPRIGIAPIAGFDDARSARELAGSIARRLEEQYGLAARRLEGDREVPRATPDAETVRRWARDGGFQRIVVGSVRDGNPPQLSLEVRDGHSGAAIDAFRIPADEDGRWGGAAVSAADRLAGAEVPTADSEERAGRDERPLLGDLRSNDDPIAIEADEIEVAVIEGRRHLQFRRNVKVVQGDVTLRTEKLDAYYPANASQPERLVATGSVRVSQGPRQATCDSATYLRSTQQVVCSGHAKLWEGCDVVRGREIRFDLEREHFRVDGAASVILQNASPDADGCPGDTTS